MAVRLWLWGLLVVLATLFWLVWLAPARLLLQPLNGMQLGPAPLQLSQIDGRWRAGGFRWQWQGLAGTARWSLAWQGLVPGAHLTLSGDLVANGWIGGLPGRWQVRDMDLAIPVAPLVRGTQGIRAEGVVSARSFTLILDHGAPREASAVLDYTGGQVSWAQGQGAVLPPLQGVMRQDGAAARIEARGPDGTLLADGSLENNMAMLRVYRAWPALLGVSQGGSPSDVVFETSRPLVDNDN